MKLENFFIDGFILDEDPGIDFSFFKGMEFVNCNSQEADIETSIPENTEQKYIDELKDFISYLVKNMWVSFLMNILFLIVECGKG